MLRSALSAIAVTAALAFASAGPTTAIAQPTDAPAEFSQPLLDRWLTVFPEIAKLRHGGATSPSEAEGLAHMTSICAQSGFESFDQCTTTIGYAGMLFAGFDPRTGTFKDPIAMAHTNIARIEGNARMPAEAKERATAPMREIIAAFPNDIPEAHLRLMTANRDRIFRVLKGAAQK